MDSEKQYLSVQYGKICGIQEIIDSYKEKSIQIFKVDECAINGLHYDLIEDLIQFLSDEKRGKLYKEVENFVENSYKKNVKKIESIKKPDLPIEADLKNALLYSTIDFLYNQGSNFRRSIYGPSTDEGHIYRFIKENLWKEYEEIVNSYTT